MMILLAFYLPILLIVLLLALSSRRATRAFATLQDITLPAGSGLPALGTILFMSNQGSPAVFNPVGNLSNLKINFKTMSADTTNMGTPWTQSIPTLLSGDTLSGELHFIPNSAGKDNTTGTVGHSFGLPGAIGQVFASRQVREYEIVYPDGTSCFFQAFVENYPVDANVEKDLKINITWKITGQPAFVG